MADNNVRFEFNAVDNVSKKLKNIKENSRSTFNTASEKTEKYRRANERLKKQLGGVKNMVGVLTGAVTAAAAGIVKMTTNTSQQIVESKRWADRLGMQVNQLRKLEYAAKNYGVTQSAIIDGLKELSMRTDEFVSQGSGQAGEAYKALGISEQQLMQVKGDTEALFNLVRSRMREINDVSRRQNIADQLFGGQGGEQLTEMLQASEEEMSKFYRQAEEGYTVGERTANQMIEWDRKLQQLKASFTSLKVTFTKEVIPILSEYIKKIKQWIDNNKQLISQNIKGLIQGIASALETLYKNWDRILSVIKTATTALIAYKGAMLAYNAAIVASTVATRGFNAVLRRNPLGLIASLLGVVIQKLGLLDGLMGGIKEKTKDVNERIQKTKTVTNKVEDLNEQFKNVEDMRESKQKMLLNNYESQLDKLKDIKSEMRDFIKQSEEYEKLQRVKTKFREAEGRKAKLSYLNEINRLKETIKQNVSEEFGISSKKLKTIISNVKEKRSELQSLIEDKDRTTDTEGQLTEEGTTLTSTRVAKNLTVNINESMIEELTVNAEGVEGTAEEVKDQISDVLREELIKIGSL